MTWDCHASNQAIFAQFPLSGRPQHWTRKKRGWNAILAYCSNSEQRSDFGKNAVSNTGLLRSVASMRPYSRPIHTPLL